MATGRAAAAVGAQLLPLLAKGAAGLGIGAAGLGTGSSVLSAGLKLTGLEKQFGQDETTQGRQRRFDRTEQDGYKLESSAPEKFFDFFMGRDTNKIREAAQLKSDAYIKNTLTKEGKDVKELADIIGGMKLDPKLIPNLRSNQSIDSYRNEINRAERIIETAKDAQQLQAGIDLSGLNEDKCDLCSCQLLCLR